MFKGKKITLYLTGGIAVYKVANFARTLIKRGADVRVAMTESATRFITPLTFEVLTKNKVHTDLFDDLDTVAHVELARWADINIVIPATANIIGKLANGIADDFVSTSLMAVKEPLFIIPAMNDEMYLSPANQRNIDQLLADGHFIMDPDTGFLAEGYEAKGRLPAEEDILNELVDWQIQLYKDQLPLYNKKVLVTAGGTIERIDPVRYISNASSGKMGHALAQKAYEMGAHVDLITASDQKINPYINRIQVESAADMYREVNSKFGDSDMLIMAAAVSDYGIKDPSNKKIKKDGQEGDTLQLNLVENKDILKTMSQRKKNQYLVGFAAETHEVEAYAKKKLEEKGLDVIVANDVSRDDAGFNVDTNEVTLYFKDGQTHHIPNTDKMEVAGNILQAILDHADQEA